MPLSNEKLNEYVDLKLGTSDGGDILKIDCDVIEFLLANCKIEIPKENRFFFKADCEETVRKTFRSRVQRFSVFGENGDLKEGASVSAYGGSYDFGHTSAEWESVIRLGIYGIRNRIAEYSVKNAEKSEAQNFYNRLLRVYDAALKFMLRVAEKARECGKEEMENGLEGLTVSAPKTLFEAMQTSIVYYVLQTCFDGTYLRTLGRLDSLFYPYYLNEDKENAEMLTCDYISEIDRLGAAANIPFAIGGTNEDGKCLVNEMSYLLLNTYRRAETTNTKLHFLCSENTPDDLIKIAFMSVREGRNSIVFMSDRRIIESLVRQGARYNDAVRYSVVGCYECGAEEEITCSCNASVNIPKALELALSGGFDMQTGRLIGLKGNAPIDSYNALCSEFERQLKYLCDCAVKMTDEYERRYPELHSAPILSATYSSALERGADIYLGYSARYNNSSLNAIGLATAADSLLAIKKAVYEDKLLSIEELTEVLRSDWEGREPLRLLIKNRYPKYGQGNIDADETAKRIVDKLSSFISGRPNAKGGTYRLGLFSIDWRWELGKRTAASADGRRNGETLSQNSGASFGADKEGVTAHLLSVSRLDSAKTPNGTVADIDLHVSSVRGENGINALLSSLRGYFACGGFAVHYNVLDTEVLKKAKEQPEKYSSLQVRLCGWNVLFSSLSEKEKDEFITRSKR